MCKTFMELKVFLFFFFGFCFDKALSQSEACLLRQYDMYILFDDSLLDCGVNEYYAITARNFVVAFAQAFTLGPQSAPVTRIGIIHFGEDDEVLFSIEDSAANNINDFEAAVAALENFAQQRCTRCALNGTTYQFTQDLGLPTASFRPPIPQVALLLTKAPNNVGASPSAAAAKLRALGVEVFVVEVNDGSSTTEALDIVCGLTSRALTVDDSNYLTLLTPNFLDELTETICDQVLNVPENPQIEWNCIEFTRRCYKPFLTGISHTWQQAEDQCLAISSYSHLPSIVSQAENDYVLSLLNPPANQATKYIWLGAQRSEDTFTWSDGLPYNFTKFPLGLPDNSTVLDMGAEDCVEMNLLYGCGQLGEWNDRPCDVGEVKNTLCKMDGLCGKRGFHNIAHMTNTIGAVDWALANGANSLQLHLQFDASGSIVKFQHGSPCDCTCLCTAGTCPSDSVCSALEIDYPTNPCLAESTNASALLAHIASKRAVVSLLIESRGITITDLSDTILSSAGEDVAQLLVDDLFGQGYEGVIVLSVSRIPALPYLAAAKQKMDEYPQYKRFVYYTIDCEKNNIVDALTALYELGTSNLVYSTGRPAYIMRPACGNSPFAGRIDVLTMELAAYNEARGVDGLTIAHTLDDTNEINDAFKYFRGAVTNFPAKVKAQALAYGLGLATPCDLIVPSSSYDALEGEICSPCNDKIKLATATSDADIVQSTNEFSCTCTYETSGCQITVAAPQNTACFCILDVALTTCSGVVIACKDQYAAACEQPTISKESCLQGGGDCAGYP